MVNNGMTEAAQENHGLKPMDVYHIRQEFGTGSIIRMTAATHPEIISLYEILCTKAGIKPSALYVVESEETNGLSLPGKAGFVFSTANLKRQAPEEICALIGHEMGHQSRRDFLIGTLPLLSIPVPIATMAAEQELRNKGVPPPDTPMQQSIKGFFTLLAIPFTFLLSRKAVGHCREKAADRKGAEFAGSGAMESLLDKTRVEEGEDRKLVKELPPWKRAKYEVTNAFMNDHPSAKARLRNVRNNKAKESRSL